MEFGSDAHTPLWELWCEGVSGCCYQKGSPLDIESFFGWVKGVSTPTHLDTISPALATSPNTDTPLLVNLINHFENVTPEPTPPHFYCICSPP